MRRAHGEPEHRQAAEYLELARRLLTAVDDGRMTLAASTCPLHDLFNAEWPADVVEHNFVCNACGRSFQLFADTFHGHAGWGLTGPPTKEPSPEQNDQRAVHCICIVSGELSAAVHGLLIAEDRHSCQSQTALCPGQGSPASPVSVSASSNP